MFHLWICVAVITLAYSKHHAHHHNHHNHHNVGKHHHNASGNGETVSLHKYVPNSSKGTPNIFIKKQKQGKSSAFNESNRLSTATHKKTEVKSIEKIMLDSVEIAGNIAGSMGDAGKVDKLQFETRMVNAKKKAIEFKRLNKYSKGLAIAESTGTGITTLAKGIQSGSWTDIVSGGLAVAAAIAAFMGPVGVMVSIGLTLFSLVFGLLGGATGGEESTESMTKRLLEDALLDQTEDDLRDGASGLKKVYVLLSKSTANLRKADHVSVGQAVEFYNQAFVGIKMFGILEFYIDKWCFIGNYDDIKKEEINKNATRCLEFVNLYCDLAILRQLLVTDLACFMSEKKLEESARNLLVMIAAEQRADMEFLKFLFKPIDHRRHRYISAKFVTSLEKYKTLTNYLLKLDEISLMEFEKEDVLDEAHRPDPISHLRPLTHQEENSRKLLKDTVLYCTGKYLQNDCYENQETGVFNKNSEKFRNWENKIKSFFISRNLKVVAYYQDNFEVDSQYEMLGPGIYNIHNEQYKIKSIKIFRKDSMQNDNEDDDKYLVKVCEQEDMDMGGMCASIGSEKNDLTKYPDKTVAGENCEIPFKYDDVMRYSCISTGGDFWCSIGVTEGRVHKSGQWGYCKPGDNIQGDNIVDQAAVYAIQDMSNWGRRIVSVAIPPSIMLKGVDYFGKPYGPYYGPYVINKLPSQKTWKTITVEPTTIEATQLLKICTNETLRGFCDHIIPPSVVNDTMIQQLSELKGTSWTQKDLKIKSMNIPGGIEVLLVSSADKEFGPYTGPATVKKVDGSDDVIHELKIKRLY